MIFHPIPLGPPPFASRMAEFASGNSAKALGDFDVA